MGLFGVVNGEHTVSDCPEQQLPDRQSGDP